jgi:hypothetical protein
MQNTPIETATPEDLAPVLLSALQRRGQLGREGAVALSRLVADDDANFDEAAEWNSDVAAGGLRE